MGWQVRKLKNPHKMSRAELFEVMKAEAVVTVIQLGETDSVRHCVVARGVDGPRHR